MVTKCMLGTSKINREDESVKQRVLIAANNIDLMSAMSMNRHERRRLSKINKMAPIAGSIKPHIANR